MLRACQHRRTAAPPWTGYGYQLESILQRVQDVEWQSRAVEDWFTPALTFAVLAFLYCAVFCQRVVTDDSAVDALSPGRALPAATLVLLIVLFCNIVLDRICYSIGSNAGKAVLHLLEVPLYFIGGWLLFWSASTTAIDRWHLKVCCFPPMPLPLPAPAAVAYQGLLQVFMALRLCSMALSAVQVKAGYPSTRDAMTTANGQGRHAFYFYRHVDVSHWLFFQVRPVNVPCCCRRSALYLLRALLLSFQRTTPP